MSIEGNANGFSAAQRQAILKRDNHTCQADCALTRFCGGPRDRVDVHHIRSRRWCREHNLNPNTLRNGITLCRTYHESLHCGFEHNGDHNWDPNDDVSLLEVTFNGTVALLNGDKNRKGRKRIRRRLLRLFNGQLGVPDS